MVKFKSIILLFVTYVLCPFSLFLCLIFKIIHFISFVGSLARGFFFYYFSGYFRIYTTYF